MDKFLLNQDVKRAKPALPYYKSFVTAFASLAALFGTATVLYRRNIKVTSQAGLSLTFCNAVLTYLALVVFEAFYNLYLHPLSNFPGPRLWIALPFLKNIASVRGLADVKLREFHLAFGEVVRFTPNELSFITADAWKDIYGHGGQQKPKYNFRHASVSANIINSSNEEHTRYRKALAHAFSEKALRDQEPYIGVYVDQLISQLKGFAVSQEKVDMVKWYNLTTFDLIGDLAFGEPFDGLKLGEKHPWIAILFAGVKTSPFIVASLEYPILRKIIPLLMPPSLMKGREKHGEYTKATVMKRVHNKAMHGRPDFMDAMLKHRSDDDGLTDDELIENSKVLILAGSETTATLLSGVTYWLLRTPEALRKVTDEVRSAFARDQDINFIDASARLPYMLACLEEAFRMYPPVPTGLQRITLPGGPSEISGYNVPAGTRVAVHQSAAYRSPHNFHLPNSFMPERWLPQNQDPASPFYNDNRAVLQPFSVGPRNCIGRNLAYNEMRLILARVMWDFDLELCEESANWNEQLSYLLWEKSPLMCKLSMR